MMAVQLQVPEVAPCTGAWIETFPWGSPGGQLASRPVRARGLKHDRAARCGKGRGRALYGRVD